MITKYSNKHLLIVRLRIPTGKRQTSLLFTKRDRGFELGTTEKQIPPVTGRRPWTRDLRITTPAPWISRRRCLPFVLTKYFNRVVPRHLSPIYDLSKSVFLVSFCSINTTLVMQRHRLTYQGISHELFVFLRYTHEPSLSETVYQENTISKWDITWYTRESIE